MTKLKVLFICHNHPSIRPGGAEGYAYDLYQELRRSSSVEPYLLSAARPDEGAGEPHPGTFVAPVGEDPNDYFFYTAGYDYDWLNGTMVDKDFYTKHVRAFLRALDPDVVHLQHTLFLGYDLLREIRNSCPRARIVYTLHEFLPICHHHGQMIRTVNNQELCTAATPRRCHECFPGVSAQSFFMRKRFIQAQFELVDMFLVPSRLLLSRYIEWGIPADRIQYEECGRIPVQRTPPSARPVRNRLGFFGQISPFKGVDVLLDAMRLLEAGPAADARQASPWMDPAPSAPPHLWVYGANLELQDTTYQQRFRSLLDSTADSVSMMGRYVPEEQGALMEGVDWVVVPSIWWENAPRVIQEAFQHGRPVICSNIGGMAEKVTDGVDGLHFRVGDARSLAETIRRAVAQPGLWDQLHADISPTYRMDAHVTRLEELYRELQAAPQRGRRSPVA